MNIEKIAQTAHEINRAYCASIGDNSQPTWADAPDWQKDSAIAGVKFHLENPDATPSASHESWLAQKKADGWKYGTVKNPDMKEHPCFIPYEQLPIEQKTKDFLFKQTIDSLRGSLDKRNFETVEQGTHYELPEYKVVDGKGIVPTGKTLPLKFVRGSKLKDENVEKREGTLHEHLLSAMISDLKYKNGLVPSRETSIAITSMEAALHSLEEREHARAAAGVVGTYKKH